MDKSKLICKPVTIEWVVEDVIKCIEDNDIEPAEKVVECVIEYINIERLERNSESYGIESGWNVIQDAVEDYIKYELEES